MEGYDYDAAASTIKVEDITSSETNRRILRSLKVNDPSFDELWMTSSRVVCGDNEYFPGSARDLAWLGYYIGQNATLQCLHFDMNPLQDFDNDAAQPFFRGINSNRSIQKITFIDLDLSRGEIFQSLGPFFENNNNLSELDVERCQFGAGCTQQLSLALRDCNKSLKCIKFGGNRMGADERLADIIEALAVHPQLEEIELFGINIGRNECQVLAALLRGTGELHTLNLSDNEIDDEGVDILGDGLANSNLNALKLSYNSVTA